MQLLWLNGSPGLIETIRGTLMMVLHSIVTFKFVHTSYGSRAAALRILVGRAVPMRFFSISYDCLTTVLAIARLLHGQIATTVQNVVGFCTIFKHKYRANNAAAVRTAYVGLTIYESV
jgi:hypothetical protein